MRQVCRSGVVRDDHSAVVDPDRCLLRINHSVLDRYLLLRWLALTSSSFHFTACTCAFSLAPGLCAVDGGWFCSAGTTQTIQVFVIWGVLPDSRGAHVVTEVCFLLLGLTPGIWR